MGYPVKHANFRVKHGHPFCLTRTPALFNTEVDVFNRKVKLVIL
jgi:hypothetical protein